VLAVSLLICQFIYQIYFHIYEIYSFSSDYFMNLSKHVQWQNWKNMP